MAEASAGRARAIAGGVLAVAVVLAGGSVYALHRATSNSSDAVLAAPTPGATEAPSPTASPTSDPVLPPLPSIIPSATATPSPTPSLTPSPTASATPPARVSPTASPTVRYYRYPSPTQVYAGLTLTATLSPQTGGRIGDTFTLRVVGPAGATGQAAYGATDGDGTIYFNGISWGDGSAVQPVASADHCPAYPPLTSPPPPYQPEPDAQDYGPFTHEFTTAGPDTITVRVRSENADCKPNGPAKEYAELTFHITVYPST